MHVPVIVLAFCAGAAHASALNVSVRHRLALPILLAVLGAPLIPRVARADEDLDRARALFDEAGELEKQGQWGAAQEKLRAAIRIKETPHLRFALGWALENNDKLLEARVEYELAQRLAVRSGVDEVAKLSANRIAEVDRKTPLVQVRVRGTISKDTRVLVDERVVAMRDDVGTISVDPGSRVVRLEKNGRTSTEQTVTVPPGGLRVVEVKGDDGIAVQPDPLEPQKGSALPWVLVGVGGAMAISSVVLFVSSGSDADTRDQNTARWCDATACTGGAVATRPETAEAAAFRREAYDAADRGNTKQVAGAILGVAGVAGIAIGTYLLLDSGGREAPAAPSTAAKAKSARVRLDAAPLPGGGYGGATFAF